MPKWIRAEKLPPSAVPGARIFAQVGCLVCHTYLGSGSHGLGGPDLTAEGTHHRGIRWQIEHLRCPMCLNANSQMPHFRDLGAANLRRIAIFLEASKGVR